MSRTVVLDPPVAGRALSSSAATLAELRVRYRQAVPATLAALEAVAMQLLAAPDAEPVLLTLRRELHRIHGSGGTYGFAEASRVAAALEARVAQWLAEPSLDRDRRAAVVRSVARLLAHAFGQDEEPGHAADLALDGTPVGTFRLLLAGFSPAAAARLRVAAAARGIAAVAWIAEECTIAALAAFAPDVVVAPATLPAAQLALLGAAGAPLLLAGTPDGHVPAGATVLAGDEAVPLLELAERLAAHSAWRGATVVAVDDDPVMLAVLRALLGVQGFNVVSLATADGLEARLEAEPPALLLLDVELGGTDDGIVIADRLRRNAALAGLPILLLSGHSDVETRTRAFAAGVDEFIVKPIVAAELRARVEDRLGRERLRALAAETHPATRLPLPARARRELAHALADARAGGASSAVAVVRHLPPSADDAADGAAASHAAAAAWTHQCRRLGTALRAAGATLGHRDATSLAVYLPLDAGAAVAALTALAPSAGDAGAWRAAVVEPAEHPAASVEQLLGLAAEALDAPMAGNACVRCPARQTSVSSAPDVVIVEDDTVLAEMLQYAMRSAGLTQLTFASGSAALEALLALPLPAGGARPLVMLDVDLPGLDGHSLHERLTQERPDAFRVVFTSAHADEGGQLRALRAGALDYVVKPLSLAVFLAKVPLWLASARAAA